VISTKYIFKGLNLLTLKQHQQALQACQQCKEMTGPPVTGEPVMSKILLVGQAPGDKEPILGKPFAWTAGKTLFKWFTSIGLDEQAFRQKVYMAAVCRCFPGKNPKGGDRVPSKEEMARCAGWLEAEMHMLQPELIIPVGKLAIAQFMPVSKLVDVIGQAHEVEYAGFKTQAIPLPHPSGASTWHRMQPGKTLLEEALGLIAKHPNWRVLL
jgi:uracil-DNA glycosylase